MRFAQYLGRCIYGEESGSGEGVVTNALCALPGTRLYLRRGVEREGKRRRDGLNQCAKHIIWDAHEFTERRGKGEGVVTNAICALPGTRLYLLRGEEREGGRR